MKATFRLGRIGGVEVGVHWTVGLIVVLAAWALSGSLLPEVVAGQTDLAYTTAGILGAIGLMASILAHELSHALVAQRDDVGVRSITLWMLGGVAELGGHARSARSEFRIAIAGPAMSFAIGIVSMTLAAFASAAGLPELVAATLAWLSLVNVVLAMFNLLPGAPLDGGRVLTAILWRRSGDEQAARRRSARAGEVLGQVLVVGGLVMLAAFGSADGLWLALIGWFVLSTAKAEEEAAEMETAFEDLTVADVMTTPVETAEGRRTVSDFVAHDLIGSHAATFPLVGPFGKPTGVLTLRQLRGLPRERWATTPLVDIATPATRMTVAHPEDRLVDVLTLARSGDGRVVVIDPSGRLVGLVTPSDVTNAFERLSLVHPIGR